MAKFYSIKFYAYPKFFHSPLGICVIIISLVAWIFFTLGLVGYQANFVQFGLDQLLELPSHYLGLFVHYVVWAFQFVSVPLMVFLLLWCYSSTTKAIVQYVSSPLPIVVLLLMGILLIIVYRKKRWFFTKVGQKNPYKTVFEIINFVRKHKYPVPSPTVMTTCHPDLILPRKGMGAPSLQNKLKTLRHS